LVSIALPFKAPAFKLGKAGPVLGLLGAAVLFIAAATGVVMLMGPTASGSSVVEVALDRALKTAPMGWREAMRPLVGEPTVEPDVVRLSERPLNPLAGISWNGPTGVRLYSSGALPPAPMAGFFAPGPGGPLPIIAADGRTPAQVYARPFTANGRPRIAVVVGGLGLDAKKTRQAIETLPPEITLSFVVYAEGLQGWIDLARSRGHEVLLEAPMEPKDYPENDPGPYTLMSDGQPTDIVKKLEWILSRATGYFGLSNYMGSRFLQTDPAYNAFAAAMRGRGLAFFDDGSAEGRGGGMARATADIVIDAQPTATAVDQELLALEAAALQHGQAVGLGQPRPLTLEKVARWAPEITRRGYQLAPVSGLATVR
jgi:polysaccharide deacetylase 2 family uncharacterized protein YibQ